MAQECEGFWIARVQKQVPAREQAGLEHSITRVSSTEIGRIMEKLGNSSGLSNGEVSASSEDLG